MTAEVEGITVVLTDDKDIVLLHFKGCISPAWPFREQLTAQFRSDSDITTHYLEVKWPDVPVRIVNNRTNQDAPVRDAVEQERTVEPDGG